MTFDEFVDEWRRQVREYGGGVPQEAIDMAEEAWQLARTNALTMAEHPGIGRTAQAEYYEAVHQELAPLARQLERDARKWRMKLHQLRLDVLSVMPENWREDPGWVALAENQKLTQKVGAGRTARKTPNA